MIFFCLCLYVYVFSFNLPHHCHHLSILLWPQCTWVTSGGTMQPCHKAWLVSNWLLEHDNEFSVNINVTVNEWLSNGLYSHHIWIQSPLGLREWLIGIIDVPLTNLQQPCGAWWRQQATMTEGNVTTDMTMGLWQTEILPECLNILPINTLKRWILTVQ